MIFPSGSTSALRRFADGGCKDAARPSSELGAWCDIAPRISTLGLHSFRPAGTLAKDALVSHGQARRTEEREKRSVMAVYKQPKSKYWWCKFTWNGEPIRQSTKQSNKRVAEQMEAATGPHSRRAKSASATGSRYRP